MITGNTEPSELRKYFRALQRAQRDIDLRPEAYTHYYQNEFPQRYHTTMDHEAMGTRPNALYSSLTPRRALADSREWTCASHEIFGPGGLGTGTYEQVIACPVQSPAR